MDEVIPELQTLAPNAEVYYQNEYKTGQKQGKGFMKAANEHFDSGNRSDEESEEEARYFVVSELSDDYKNQEDEPVPLKVESLEDYLGKDPKKNPQIIKSAKRRKPHQYLNSERKVYKEQSKNQKKKQEKGSLFKLLQRVRGKK